MSSSSLIFPTFSSPRHSTSPLFRSSSLWNTSASVTGLPVVSPPSVVGSLFVVSCSSSCVPPCGSVIVVGLPQFFPYQNTILLQDILPKIQPSSQKKYKAFTGHRLIFSQKIQDFYISWIKVILLLPNFYDPIVHRTVKYKSLKKNSKIQDFYKILKKIQGFYRVFSKYAKIQDFYRLWQPSVMVM